MFISAQALVARRISLPASSFRKKSRTANSRKRPVGQVPIWMVALRRRDGFELQVEAGQHPGQPLGVQVAHAHAEFLGMAPGRLLHGVENDPQPRQFAIVPIGFRQRERFVIGVDFHGVSLYPTASRNQISHLQRMVFADECPSAGLLQYVASTVMKKFRNYLSLCYDLSMGKNGSKNFVNQFKNTRRQAGLEQRRIVKGAVGKMKKYLRRDGARQKKNDPGAK